MQLAVPGLWGINVQAMELKVFTNNYLQKCKQLSRGSAPNRSTGHLIFTHFHMNPTQDTSQDSILRLWHQSLLNEQKHRNNTIKNFCISIYLRGGKIFSSRIHHHKSWNTFCSIQYSTQNFHSSWLGNCLLYMDSKHRISYRACGNYTCDSAAVVGIARP